MNASDLMTEDPMTLPVTAKVKDAVAILQTLEFRHIPIVGSANELLGMVSDRDLRSARAADLEARIVEIMSADVMSVGPEADATEVIDLMVDTRVGAVPVVDQDGGALVGIISYIDVLRQLRDKLSSEEGED